MFKNPNIYKSIDSNNKLYSENNKNKYKMNLLSNENKKNTNFTNKLEEKKLDNYIEINEEEFEEKYKNNSEYNVVQNVKSFKDSYVIDNESDNNIVNKCKIINKPNNIKIKYIDKIVECYVEEKVLVFKKVQVPVKILKIKPVENIFEIHKNVDSKQKHPIEIDHTEVNKLTGNYEILPVKTKYKNVIVNKDKPIIIEDIEIKEIPVIQKIYKKQDSKLSSVNFNSNIDLDVNLQNNNNIKKEFQSIPFMYKNKSKNNIKTNFENNTKLILNDQINNNYKIIKMNVNNNIQDIKENKINNKIIYENVLDSESKAVNKQNSDPVEILKTEYKVKNIYEKKEVVKDRPKYVNEYVKNDIIVEELSKNIVKNNVEYNRYSTVKIPKKTIKYVKNIEEETIELPVDNYINENEEKIVYKYNYINKEDSINEDTDKIEYVKIKKEVPKIKYIDKIIEKELIVKKETEKIVYDNQIIPIEIEKQIDIENIIYEPRINNKKVIKNKYIKVPIKNEEIENYTNNYISQFKKNQDVLRKSQIKKLELQSQVDYLRQNDFCPNNSKISYENQNDILRSTIASLRENINKKMEELKNYS